MYICECGKEFDNPQKFNGHKTHCKIHLACVGKLDNYFAASIKRSSNSTKTKHSNYVKKVELDMQQ